MIRFSPMRLFYSEVAGFSVHQYHSLLSARSNERPPKEKQHDEDTADLRETAIQQAIAKGSRESK